MANWKAVRAAVDAPLELYDLKNDPGEKTNVADRNPQVVARVTNLLKTARTDDPHWPVPTGHPLGDEKPVNQ